MKILRLTVIGLSSLLLFNSEITIAHAEAVSLISEALEGSDFELLENQAAKDEVGSNESEDVAQQQAVTLPAKKVLKGTRVLTCVAVKYTDIWGATQKQCQDFAETVAEYYKRNSRGLFQLKPTSVVLEVNYPAKKESLGPVGDIIRRTIKSDYYMFVNNWKFGGNHAGARVAMLTQLTGWVGEHEVGHLLGINHTGRYTYNADGKVSGYNQYGDTDSVMSSTGNKYLTAPQYYQKGWLPADEVALFDGTNAVYDLKKISDFAKDGTSIVAIPASVIGRTGAPAYLAYSSSCKGPCATLYLASGGSSQRIATTLDTYHDSNFTGLTVKVLGSVDGRARVSLEYVGK